MKRFSLLLSLVVALPCFAGKAKAITGDECEPRFEHHWEQGCVAKSETWKERHESKLAEIKASGGTYDVVFIGDSITHRFEGVGQAVKEELEKTRRILWLGYGGDRTEQALWLDINDKFTSPDVKDYKTLLHDGTHPTETGYRIWASALVPVLNDILR